MDKAKDDLGTPRLSPQQAVRLAALQNRQVTNATDIEREALEFQWRCWCVERAIDYAEVTNPEVTTLPSALAKDIYEFISKALVRS